ncbi:ciliary microtubule inner protein 4 isoform X2 [Ascaphus truei]|uniref:ciliary microtubule inner protein 4 isoform X2 n=1 Tax=Ascaphus truei TaxID=8439 RepID=UPI003F59FE8E
MAATCTGDPSDKCSIPSSLVAEPGSPQAPPSSPTTRGGTSLKAHPKDGKAGPGPRDSEIPCSIGAGGRESRPPKTAEQGQDTKSLIPPNIRHKYGSALVDQLISPEQVRRALKEAEEDTQSQQGYHIPRLHKKEWLMGNSPHGRYYALGHCLRANLFPGVPITSRSLVQDSYTAEVNEKGKLDMRDTSHWHGRTIDDLGRWQERSINELNWKKALDQKNKGSGAKH